MSSPTRRDFLRTTSATAAFFAAARPGDLLRAARPRPLVNGRMNVGIIGFGVRARELLGPFLDDKLVEITLVADVVTARAEEGVRLVNERRAAQVCRRAAHWREIVADPGIDAVLIATPDHAHAEPAIAACLAGRHVYCEKPLSLTIAEGRAIANAAWSSGVRFQTGSQQRSEFSHFFVRAAEAVRNGRIGALQRITIGIGAPPVPCDLPEQPLPPGIDWDGWLGQAPLRGFHEVLCPVGMHNHYPMWRSYREYCNGGLADMGAHHFDIAQWAMDMDASGPREVIPPAGDAVTGLRFLYENGVEMVHGGPTDCTFEGKEGVIECSRGHVKALRNGVEAPQLLEPPTAGEAALPRNASHVADFLGAIREGRDPICTAEIGHRTATVCQLAVIGYEVRKPLSWDPVTERFTGANAEAGNALLARPVRKHA